MSGRRWTWGYVVVRGRLLNLAITLVRWVSSRKAHYNNIKAKVRKQCKQPGNDLTLSSTLDLATKLHATATKAPTTWSSWGWWKQTATKTTSL